MLFFYQQNDSAKSQLMYSSSISLCEVINDAYWKEKKTEIHVAFSTYMDALATGGMHTLYHAAQIIKSDLKDAVVE